MENESKTVWITGGRSGIGNAIAAGFVRQNATVYISSRDAGGLEEAATALGGNVHALACDVTDAEDVRAAYAQIAESHGQVDVLVNNAGATVFSSFLESEVQDFDDLLATNLRGPFLTSKAVLPAMVERGTGTIVMINSMAALQVFPNSSLYAATKGGLKMLSDCMRSEVRASGVRVISVFPGATNTPIWPDKVREKHGSRMMTAEDVAHAVLTACSAPEQVLFEDIVMQPIGGGI